MLGKVTGGEGRRPVGQPKSWHRPLFDECKTFDATKGCTEHPNLDCGVDAEV